MFEKIDVWKRVDGKCVARYQCLKRMSDGLFTVQNTDFLYLPISLLSLKNSDQQFLELFMDDDPSDRCDWFPSLIEAINKHNAEFD